MQLPGGAASTACASTDGLTMLTRGHSRCVSHRAIINVLTILVVLPHATYIYSIRPLQIYKSGGYRERQQRNCISRSHSQVTQHNLLGSRYHLRPYSHSIGCWAFRRECALHKQHSSSQRYLWPTGAGPCRCSTILRTRVSPDGSSSSLRFSRAIPKLYSSSQPTGR